tara:strand:- start:7 stop:192 length:186 start_codon:yes stop_codon:yes gene_type:complete
MKLREKAFELVSNAEVLALEVTNAEAGNMSANRRARKLSVIIREKFKELRKELLKLEKGEL